jgi:hypothetical protein
MTNEHPITPPPELVHQWVDMLSSRSDQAVFTMAAQWGADQELEACCECIPKRTSWDAERLYAARRPKPPTLKEQALAVLMALEIDEPGYEGTYNTIRRALEALDD